MRRAAAAGLAAAALSLLAGCGGSDAHSSVVGARPHPAARHPAATAVRAAAPQHAVAAQQSARQSSTAHPHPPFSWHTSHVTARSLGRSWHSGCPVGPSELRALHLTFWGFDHQAHRGTLIVHARKVSDYVAAFRSIYHHRFPIRRMRPIAAYGGSDNRSMRHDNTSAFNCRYAVANGPKRWSMHAYGEAVDINTVENPYELDGKVRPPKGAPYMDRSNVRPGMIVNGSVPVHAFAAVGWGWGGYWSDSPDYQHFSSTGQ